MASLPMVVSQKQRTEIHIAIATYLKARGYAKSFECFMSEADDVQLENIDENSQTLERKFLTNARLQVKVNTLEKQLAELQNEASREAPTRDKRKEDEWLPRPPELLTLSGHRMPVNRVIFHPRFNIIVSGSDDAAIRVWDALSGRCERILTGHTNAINDLAFNKKGNILVSCSSDMTTKIWDFHDSYSCLKTIAGHDHSISSVAVYTDTQVITASRDTFIKLWDTENIRCIHNFRGHENWVRMIRLSPSNKYLASCSADKLVKIWDMDAKELVVDLRGHDHVVECIAWATNLTVDSLKIEDVDIKDPDVIIAGRPIVIASAGRDKIINVWHVNVGSPLFVLDGHDNWIRGIVFHPLGRYLISVGDDRTMRPWDLETKKVKKIINPHNNFVVSVDFHKTEPFVVTASSDANIKVWECR